MKKGSDYSEDFRGFAPQSKSNTPEAPTEGKDKAIISEAAEREENDRGIVQIIRYAKKFAKPEDYGIVVRDISAGMFGKNVISPTAVSILRKEMRSAGISAEDAEDILFRYDKNTQEIYNLLTLFDKKFIIALQVLLSDQTTDRHKIIEMHRPTRKKKEGTLEIPDIFTGVDKNGIPSILAEDLKKSGFNDKDIIVFIFGKRSFLTDYLGYTNLSGREYSNFDITLSKLRKGLFAYTAEAVKGKARFSKVQSLIKQIAMYNYSSSGGAEYNIYAIALTPLLTENISNKYRLIPKDNAKYFKAIGDNEALFNLYDWILLALSEDNYRISERGAIKVVEKEEEDILNLLARNKEDLRKHKKRYIDILYKGLKIFYDLGLLNKEVIPPTTEARNAAKANRKSIVLKIYINYIANGGKR